MIAEAKDANLFPSLEIPRSTAMSWIRNGVSEVVTVPSFEFNEAELVVQNEKLRKEIAEIIATQKLQSFTCKLFGLQIQFKRLPTSDSKSMVISAIGSAVKAVDLKTCLDAIGLSSFSITSLALYAKRCGDVFASVSSWHRIIRSLDLSRYVSRIYPLKPRLGIRASKPNEIWHLDMSVIKLADGTRCFIQAIVDNFSRYVVAQSVSQSYGGISTKNLLELPLSSESRFIRKTC